MITPRELAEAYAGNLEIIRMQTKGLTHADSLLQPPVRGNCLNWVLGHLASSRNGLLKLLGLEPVMADTQADRYGYGSEPVTGEGEGVMRMEDLLAALERSQERLSAWLERATPEDLAREVDLGWRKSTLAAHLFFMYFHDTYHTGQTELLRQLAGTNDKVI
ncbi:MAG: DinB family protein [Anaerolineae bacterium]|nr:DinB family protein [Anaerolineae bacterium]